MRQIFESLSQLDEIHSFLLRILMWNYRSKLNYLCVKLRVHFCVISKKKAGSSGSGSFKWAVLLLKCTLKIYAH